MCWAASSSAHLLFEFIGDIMPASTRTHTHLRCTYNFIFYLDCACACAEKLPPTQKMYGYERLKQRRLYCVANVEKVNEKYIRCTFSPFFPYAGTQTLIHKACTILYYGKSIETIKLAKLFDIARYCLQA